MRSPGNAGRVKEEKEKHGTTALSRREDTLMRSDAGEGGREGFDARSLLASACTNLSMEQASLNSGGNQASWGRTLSTMRTSEARLFLWICRARKRPMYPRPPMIRTEGFSAMVSYGAVRDSGETGLRKSESAVCGAVDISPRRLRLRRAHSSGEEDRSCDTPQERE